MLRMTSNKVAVQPRYDPDTSAGGIIIPDVAKERCDQGIIKYIGPKVKDVKIGDYVLFGGYVGETIQFGKDGEGTLIILDERHIKAIFGSINTDINGLYFKSKIDVDAIRLEFAEILNQLKFNTITVDECINSCVAVIGRNDPYFPATYEIATQIIMDSFTNAPLQAKLLNKIFDREQLPEIDDEDEDII